MKRVMIVAVCLLTAAAAGAEEDLLNIAHISVSGTAETTIAPDVVVWNATAQAEDMELAEATKSVQKQTTSVLDLAEELGVPQEDTQTGYLSVNRLYDRDEQGNVTAFKGYRVSRGITIRQQDLSKFDAMLTGLMVDAGVTAGYSFDSEAMEEVRWETRIKAVETARRKAEEMAVAAGAKVAGVLRIHEQQQGPQPMMSNMAFGRSGGEADVSTGSLAPGQIRVRVSVDADFALSY
jgi:hypothetical protein